MPSALTRSHIEAERRLRRLIDRAVTGIWRNLPGYDRENVDEWLSKVIPAVAAGQRHSAALTDAYLARALDRRPFGVRFDDVTGAGVRNGTPPEEEWLRPMVTVWGGLSEGLLFTDAVGKGLARAQSMAAFDVQASMRATASIVQGADDGILGYTRVANAGACAFCSEIDGAFVKSADAMSLHNGCGCGLEPITSRSDAPSATQESPNVATHEHGEMGPVLGAPDQAFTSAADVPAL